MNESTNKAAPKKTRTKKAALNSDIQDKSIDLLAKETISGKYGDEDGQKEALGDRYDEVKEKAADLIESAGESWTGIVATEKDGLRVRREPDGEILRLLDKGSEVQLIGSDQGGWYKLADGSGYVSSKLIIKK